MTPIITKVEKTIKSERFTPERKVQDDSKKTSSEILSELFGAFNADPPKIKDSNRKKAKKSKKKHKKGKKKRSRNSSCSGESGTDCTPKLKKRKKKKLKRRRSSARSPSYPYPRSCTPLLLAPKIERSDKYDSDCLSNTPKHDIKGESKEEYKSLSLKTETSSSKSSNDIDACLIPMPSTPDINKLDSQDLRYKLESKKDESIAENDKLKGKIQIKNLKFSTVFEETVKKAEEEARKRAEKYEEGEYTDSSESIREELLNTDFPKSSDIGGILYRQADLKLVEEEKSSSKKSKESRTSHKSSYSHKSSHRERSSSRKRGKSKSKRSQSRSPSRKRHRRSSSGSRRKSRSRHRSRSRSDQRSGSKSRKRSRHRSPRHRSRRSRSPTGVKLADSEKKRLLEVARRNAINMLKNGAVPAGAAALPLHTRNQVMAAIQSGGKSVDELTDFCKHLSKKEALGELSSVSSNDENMSENEDTIAFHHPFLVKEKAPIVMNIRGGAPLPVKPTNAIVANKDELRLQFPVSSGSQHREKASEWVPVSPKSDSQIARLNCKPPSKTSSTLEEPAPSAAPLALPAPTVVDQPDYMKNFSAGPQLSSIPALPAPGPQAYPPGLEDISLAVAEKLSMIRRNQEQNELMLTNAGFGWQKDSTLGEFTGSTCANILTPRELASGTQAWAKKDQLVRAAPVEGGMGMHLLQKMGWTPGQGLGKEGTGTLQPLLLEVKLDTRGLQAKEETTGRNSKGVKIHRIPRRGPSSLNAGGKHPVSLLGEYCSKHKLGPPEYDLCYECGPDHKKNFLFKVRVASIEYQPAVASANKKQAKADAAQLALQKLGVLI